MAELYTRNRIALRESYIKMLLDCFLWTAEAYQGDCDAGLIPAERAEQHWHIFHEAERIALHDTFEAFLLYGKQHGQVSRTEFTMVMSYVNPDY